MPSNQQQIVFNIWHNNGQSIPIAFHTKVTQCLSMHSKECYFILITDEKTLRGQAKKNREKYRKEWLSTAHKLGYHAVFTIENYVDALENYFETDKDQNRVWFKRIVSHIYSALKNNDFAIASDIERLLCLHYGFSLPNLVNFIENSGNRPDNIDLLYADLDRMAENLTLPLVHQSDAKTIANNDLLFKKYKSPEAYDLTFAEYCLGLIADKTYPKQNNAQARAIDFSGPEVLSAARNCGLIEEVFPIAPSDNAWCPLGAYELRLRNIKAEFGSEPHFISTFQKKINSAQPDIAYLQLLGEISKTPVTLGNLDNRHVFLLIYLNQNFETVLKDKSSKDQFNQTACGPFFQIIVYYYPKLAQFLLKDMEKTMLIKNISYRDGMDYNLIGVTLENLNNLSNDQKRLRLNTISHLMQRAKHDPDVLKAITHGFCLKAHDYPSNLIIYCESGSADLQIVKKLIKANVNIALDETDLLKLGKFMSTHKDSPSSRASNTNTLFNSYPASKQVTEQSYSDLNSDKINQPQRRKLG